MTYTNIQPSDLVNDEASFRSSFEDLCRTTLKYPFGTPLLVRFQTQPIGTLATAVEASEQQYNPPLQLALLIWACIWEAMIVRTSAFCLWTRLMELRATPHQTACNAGIHQARIVNLLRELNHAIPQVDINDLRLLYDLDVKNSFHEIFDLYLSTLLSLILNIHVVLPCE